MLELVRTFLGYCLNCRRPTLVGEFHLHGWQYKFNMCSGCIGTIKEQLDKEGVRVMQDAGKTADQEDRP